MNQDEIEALAEHLMVLRRGDRSVPAEDPGAVPPDVGVAYKVQAGIERRRIADGDRPIGYKIGATNQAARDMLGVGAPFRGRLYASSSHESGAEVPMDPHFQVIEVEIAIRLGEDLTPDMAPFHAAALETATAAIMPAIEIVGTVYRPFNKAPMGCLVADNAVHGAFVSGEPVTDWSQIDLLDGPVRLSIGGAHRADGRGGNVDDGPFAAAAFIANELARDGITLRKGEIITTGTVTPIVPLEQGVDIVAEFEGWGRVSVRIP